MGIERFCYWVCVVVGVLWFLAWLDLIDFHVCIKPAGYCSQPKANP